MYDLLQNVSTVLRSSNPRTIDSIADSMSLTQYKSKQWLVSTLLGLNLNPKRILILGGWYGTYLVPMLQQLNPVSIHHTDKDENTIKKAKQLHQHYNNCLFEVLDANVMQNFSLQTDMVINTSCEHMDDMDRIVDANPHCLYVLQSCDNKNDPGHINIVNSSEELALKSGISNIMWQGTLSLGHKSRFMVIGTK